MFFADRIVSIKPSDRVLEIGPGSLPHPRADVYLDKIFIKEEALAQNGYSAAPESFQKKIIYYEDFPFPFKDKEFDYVICSHVIEHIPLNELDIFISEIQRVAKKGYIEFPTVFYELINYQYVHKWLMNYKSDTLLFLDKKRFKSNYIHLCYRELFYCKDDLLSQTFKKYKDFFFIGFEWSDSFKYKVVNDFDDLINETDYLAMKEYFRKKSLLNGKVNENGKSLTKKLLKKYLPPLFVKVIKLLRSTHVKNISATSKIGKTSLIKISKSAEIKDYVIIETSLNEIIIGNNTQINPFSVLYGGSGIIIGNDVMIGPNCVLAAGNHDYLQTTTPMRFAGDLSKGPIIIEDDVWIGANCTITDGVIIKKGAVIGANSLICKDVEAYSIVGGVPGKQIGKRK